MDEPDTFRVNVGRHRETQPRLVRAKTYPHLVFADPPASLTGRQAEAPGSKELQATPQERPPRSPLTPQPARNCQA